MTAPSSFNVTGLLGGTAGQLDTTQLVSQLVAAAALPQTNLKNQVTVQQGIASAYQSVSSKVSTMQSAAQALTDPFGWDDTTATSSTASVVASSNTSAQAGTTTFDVLKLAAAQISTVAANGSGTVVTNWSNGISITDGGGAVHQITLSGGSAATVASAINAANVGVRASVVNTDTGTVLQLAASATGTANSFSVSGFDSAAQSVVGASDAQIGVGTGPGAYTVSSASNTFTGVIPGVTFTVAALATGVSITVGSDESSISGKVKALVDAANAAAGQATSVSSNGAILQGNLDMQTLQQRIVSAVSQGTASGGTLSSYGIDVDKHGVLSFDAAAFATAYANDPSGVQTAVGGSFATALDTVSTQMIDPTNGTITNAITSANDQQTALTKQINDWTDRLNLIQQTLQAKFTAMESALAKLQSQSTYLTSMLNNASGSSTSKSN
jgi:flagellar hook-associated protein 2